MKAEIDCTEMRASMFDLEKVKQLTSTELKVYEYFLQQSAKTIEQSVRDIAKETHVSPATVTRTISKLGFENIWELKLYLKESVNRQSNQTIFDTSAIIEEFFKRSLTAEYDADIERAVGIVLESDLVLFLGLGTSGDIAGYAARQFANLGQPAFHIQDPYYPFHLMTRKYARVAAIICSVTGETSVLLEKVEAMKNLNSRIISITNTSHNTLAKLSDVNLAYHLTEEFVDRENNINVTSQIPAIFLLETLARRTFNRQSRNLDASM